MLRLDDDGLALFREFQERIEGGHQDEGSDAHVPQVAFEPSIRIFTELRAQVGDGEVAREAGGEHDGEPVDIGRPGAGVRDMGSRPA